MKKIINKKGNKTMKNVKKVIGLLVVLAMAICMTIPAYAAETGSITIENPQKDVEYKAYKIFDVIYDAEKTNYAYTIASDSVWLNTVLAYAAQADNGLTVTKVTTADLYTVTFSEDFHAADFAEALKAANITAGAISFTDAVADNLALGYYFVTTSVGSLCNLTTTDPDEKIHDKNEKPTISKSVSDTKVAVGDTITYTLTGKVPSTTGYPEYTYEVSDKMSEGLSFNKDVVVKFGDEVIATTIDYDTVANGFTLAYDMVDYQAYVGQTITITYTATVNADAIPEGAAISVLSNEAKLVYSADPNDPTEDGEQETEADVDVYISNIVIDKYAIKANADDKSEKLEGAQFKLYKLDETGAKVYYKWDSKVTWVAADAADVVTTKENGAAQFDGIEAGTYYLEEIKAPDGYNRLITPVEFAVEINVDEAGLASVEGNVVSIGNQAGFLLPSTGGIGTTIFYILGTVLIAGAFILIVTKKRMSTEK